MPRLSNSDLTGRELFRILQRIVLWRGIVCRAQSFFQRWESGLLIEGFEIELVFQLWMALYPLFTE